MSSIKTDFINGGLGFIAVVENVDGDKYLLTADNVNEIIDDWINKCAFVPENDSKVHFVMFNNEIFNSHEMDFGSLMSYLCV